MANYHLIYKNGVVDTISFNYWYNGENNPYAMFDISDNDNLPLAISLNHFLANDYPDTNNKADNLIIIADADSDGSNLDKVILTIPVIIAYVADFKDGRIFSVIRQLRHLGYTGKIYVAGQFGLDQANYFIKSGADGFMINDNKIETLQKTLTDLQTGHFGNSVNKLPMFQ